MALRIRFAKPTAGHQLRSRILWYLLAALGCVALVGVCVFTFFYIKYARIVDERLKQPMFATTAQIYAAPREVRPGQKLTVHLIANELREAGYTADGAAQASPLGTYSEGGAADHRASRPAIVSRARQRHHPRQRRRGRLHQRRARPAAFELRARAAAHHRPERGRAAHQAPPAHLRRDSAQPGACRHRHRGPALL